MTPQKRKRNKRCSRDEGCPVNEGAYCLMTCDRLGVVDCDHQVVDDCNHLEGGDLLEDVDSHRLPTWDRLWDEHLPSHLRTACDRLGGVDYTGDEDSHLLITWVRLEDCEAHASRPIACARLSGAGSHPQMPRGVRSVRCLLERLSTLVRRVEDDC